MERLMTSKNERSFFVLFWVIVTLFYFVGQVVFAQDATAVPVSYPMLDKAQAWVSQLDSTWAMTIAVLVLELGSRTFKTTNPKSLLYVAANVLKLIAKVCTFLAESADKILQRTKDN